MSFSKQDYRQTIIRSLRDRANHYRERWSGTALSSTPWWACPSPEEQHIDDDVPDELLFQYHFDQEFAIAFMKMYSLAAPANQDASDFDRFCKMYNQSRSFDMETMSSDEAMRKALYSFMAGLDMVFFNGLFTSPVETSRGRKQRGGQELVDQDWAELETPWIPASAPLVSIEPLLAPLTGADVGQFDTTSNTLRIWCQNRDGKPFNSDYLLVVLAHEMMHAYLHIFGYQSGSTTRDHHGGEFWAGLEFIYYSIWQAMPSRSVSVLGIAAATARKNRRERIGDSDFARYSLSPAFFKGLACPLPFGLTPVMIEECYTDKL
ncbi:hypothetical protein PFICI_15180 [Pestalotiopsis fici W106-1]|uniref:Uncharacterized protein n=1 Tax=Pestalotiopsis fici (strain W106-1 / CGMCC3.15140) TaxID=1229662 RepID=W3WGF6_PESFW|nr:uncharacterized protein PFICI_15180 [Pestalotiopsis fici W106-1]ETS73005.1 hypothetical protein PFICI_15180 [Pestalotiopsis fici W106-1]